MALKDNDDDVVVDEANMARRQEILKNEMRWGGTPDPDGNISQDQPELHHLLSAGMRAANEGLLSSSEAQRVYAASMLNVVRNEPGEGAQGVREAAIALYEEADTASNDAWWNDANSVDSSN